MPNRNDQNIGFTLIELLVAITIMALLSTVVLASFRSGERSKQIQFSVDITTSAIAATQNTALSGKRYPSCASGVHYMMTLLYASAKFELACDKSVFATYNLPVKTQISSIKIDTVAVNGQGVTIGYLSPFAQVKVCPTPADGENCVGGWQSFSTIEITLDSTGTSSPRTITLSGVSGQIQ